MTKVLFSDLSLSVTQGTNTSTLCVTLVERPPSLGSGGSVQVALTTTFALSATMVGSTLWSIRL